jgi:diketogulonate reductase-like aldo/keto reductase
MDLMQIHNLTDWRTHLTILRQWKESGKIRYIGITHYKDETHEELESVMRAEPIDFVQFNYSITARHAEQRLLPAAADLGVATIINRPLGEGHFFSKVKDKILPPWALEAGIQNWSEFFLKFIISHPAVTCVIPATADPVHAIDNFKAGEGSLPDEAMRERMAEFIVGL